MHGINKLHTFKKNFLLSLIKQKKDNLFPIELLKKKENKMQELLKQKQKQEKELKEKCIINKEEIIIQDQVWLLKQEKIHLPVVKQLIHQAHLEENIVLLEKMVV